MGNDKSVWIETIVLPSQEAVEESCNNLGYKQEQIWKAK